MDRPRTRGSLQKSLDPGFIFEVQPTVSAARVNVGCQRKRAGKKDFKISGLSNWNNKVNSIVSLLDGLGKDNRIEV